MIQAIQQLRTRGINKKQIDNMTLIQTKKILAINQSINQAISSLIK